MKMLRILTYVMVSLAVIACASADAIDAPGQPAPKDVQGVWQTQGGGLKVEIGDCGDGVPCGRIVSIEEAWIHPPFDPDHLVDMNNEDESLRGRPLVGLAMLWGFESDEDRWVGGRVYSLDRGASFRANIRRSGWNTLEVEGCRGPFCRTQVWTRTTL